MRSLKYYSEDLYIKKLKEIDFPDYSNFKDINEAYSDFTGSGNLRQGSRIHCLEKCCFLKDVNNSAYCSEIWPTN